MSFPQGPPPAHQPGAPPPGYGYGYGPPQVEHPQGTLVLVLGILGIVTCQVLGPVAWVMGNRALAEIDAWPGSYSNRGNVQAGRICGIVATALLGIYVLFLGGYLVILVGVLAGSST